MAEFHCRYEDHLEQAILGFCINIGCHQTPQFCFQCFNTNQKQHQAQCLGFSTIKELIQEYIQKEHEFYGRLQNFESSFNNFINQMQKKAQNNLKKLQKMSEFLTKGEYLKFKSDIKFFRKYHSKVDETEKSKFITSINSIVSALENIKQDYIRIDDQINALTDDNNQQYMSRAKSYFEKSEQLLREGQFKEALSALNESLSMGYNHDFVYNLKGLILQNLNKLDEAIDCFDLARNINPNSENAHSNLGASLINQGKFTEGLQIIKTTIELNPKNEKAYYLKGFALYKLDKYQESQYAYEEAIKLNNRWDNAYQGKGNKYMQIFNRQIVTQTQQIQRSPLMFLNCNQSKQKQR
ncbi:unnamed protein product [Paramecium octaurelia]|uniref:Tetratricopeptide repeat protein n=2 Tax=Paramecium octaurelia TaxID=43137 RepID=A0A8S1XZW3_PAROT|nr:unnamed protein product [Paramecium octaurelia]